ncbi:MAG: hypothetical protein V4609_01430 [Pseudomonadota bacterium]
MDGTSYARASYLPGPGWGLPPVQGRTTDGQTIWGFTVEQLTGPDATIVFVPTLASSLDLSRLRGDLVREQQRAAPPSPGRLSPAVRERQINGEPAAKTRKAAPPSPDRKSDHPPTSDSPTREDEMSDLPPLITQAQAALMRADNRPTRVAMQGQTAAAKPLAIASVQAGPGGPSPAQARFQAEINALLDRGASDFEIRGALTGYRYWGTAALKGQPLAFSAGLLTGLLTMLPALKDEPAKRDLLGRALGRMGLTGTAARLSPDTQREIAEALSSPPIETTVPVDLIVDFLRSANSTGRRDLARGQNKDTPAQEKRYVLRNEYTRNGSRSGIAQALVGIFAKQVAQNAPSLATACQWVRALAGVFAGDTQKVTGAGLLRVAISELPLDAASKTALTAALAGPAQPIVVSAQSKGITIAGAAKPVDTLLTPPPALRSSLDATRSSSSSSSSTQPTQDAGSAAATLLALAGSEGRALPGSPRAGGAGEHKAS